MLHYIHVAIGLACLAIFAWQASVFVVDYNKTTGTLWQRVLAASKGTANYFWGRFKILVGSFVGALVWVATAIGQPQFAEPIKTILGNPRLIAVGLIVIGLITQAADVYDHKPGK